MAADDRASWWLHPDVTLAAPPHHPYVSLNARLAYCSHLHRIPWRPIFSAIQGSLQDFASGKPRSAQVCGNDKVHVRPEGPGGIPEGAALTPAWAPMWRPPPPLGRGQNDGSVFGQISGAMGEPCFGRQAVPACPFACTRYESIWAAAADCCSGWHPARSGIKCPPTHARLHVLHCSSRQETKPHAAQPGAYVILCPTSSAGGSGPRPKPQHEAVN
jgi:hypothetical protein